MSDSTGHEYSDPFVTALQWMWGEGFLSPGGPQEVAALLEGVEVRDKEVLDIGCGLGAIDVLLARTHGASRVTGIDVEPALVERGRDTVHRAGLGGCVEIRLVEPGPLPFDDASFDLVFSKDSIIHVQDKPALYREVLRVLRPGGVFVGSDWLRGGEGRPSEAMRHWLEEVGLRFEMKSPEQTRGELEATGFRDVRMRDRNAWYVDEIGKEIALVSGENQVRLAERVGSEAAAQRLRSSRAKLEVAARGELRPTHFHARAPD
jgi:phosphoethanolamine N-methyltransferase